MTKERDVSLKRYGVSKNRYRELKYFCRQYGEKKKRLRDLSGKGFLPADTDAAEEKERLRAELALLEETAEETDREVSSYLLKAVTEDGSFYSLGVPMSSAAFYKRKQEFFRRLDEKRKQKGY